MTALICWRGLLVLVPVLGSEIETRERLVAHLARVVGVGEDLQRLVRIGRRQVQVVVDELPEGIAEVGQALLIDGVEVLRRVRRVRLIVEDVADDAGAGLLGSDGELTPSA